MQFLPFVCANIVDEAVASFMASSLGYFLKVEPGQVFLHKCFSWVVVPGMFLGTGEGKNSHNECQKGFGCQLWAPETLFFLLWVLWETACTHPSEEDCRGTYDLLVDNVGTPNRFAWLSFPCRGVHSFYGWCNKSRKRKKLLHYFQGLVVWLTWLSAWLAWKKPWVSSLLPHILSMTVYTCNLSTQEVVGRGYVTNSLAYTRSCPTNYPTHPPVMYFRISLSSLTLTNLGAMAGLVGGIWCQDVEWLT